MSLAQSRARARRWASLAITAIAFLVALAPAAGASHDVTISFSSSAPANNATISGTLSFSVTADVGGLTALFGLRSFSAAIQSAAGQPFPAFRTEVRHPPSGDWGVLDGVSSDTISLTWDTYSLTRYNGIYEIVASARSHNHPSTETAAAASRTGLAVNNPPRAPANVSAALSGTVPVVTWEPNPELDLVEYKVLRAVNGSPDFQIIATVPKSPSPTFTDNGAQPGTSVAYRVLAARRSPKSSSCAGATAAVICSLSAATPAVAIPAPPPPSPGPDPGGEIAVTPSPGSTSGPGSTNPIVLPNVGPSPLETISLPPNIVAGPPKATKFAPLLPYQQPLPTEEPEPEAAQSEPPPAPILVQSQGPSRVDKEPYLASALLLLIGSLHIGRAARRLLVGPGADAAA